MHSYLVHALTEGVLYNYVTIKYDSYTSKPFENRPKVTVSTKYGWQGRLVEFEFGGGVQCNA